MRCVIHKSNDPLFFYKTVHVSLHCNNMYLLHDLRVHVTCVFNTTKPNN